MKMSLSASVQPCASHHDAASKHPFPRPKRARRAAKKGPMRPHAENMSSAQSPPLGRGGASGAAAAATASALAADHVGPQRLDVVGFQHVAPGRHLVLAARHRGDETVVLVGGKIAQVE